MRELDRFGSLNPQLQNRLIATLPVNALLADEAEPEVGGYVTQTEHDVITLLRPLQAGRIAARRPVEAVVRLSRPASEVTAMLVVMRRTGSDAVTCHAFYKPVDGLNKLQCPAVEPGRYDLSVIGFLNEDANKNPRPGYILTTTVQVDEMPVRNAALQ